MAEDNKSFALVNSLRDKGFSSAILATYNIYFPFFEQVVLRRLMAAGCTHVVVFCDAVQCARAFESADLRPRLAGSAYTLIPAIAACEFHPKVLLRLGKRHGSLHIGSHNLTLAGFGMNDELTNVVTYEPGAGRAAVSAFRATIDFLAAYLPPEMDAVRDTFNAALASAPWLSGPVPVPDDFRVLASRPDGPNLWELIKEMIPRPISRVLVMAPFFDPKLSFLSRIRTDLRPTEAIVAIDPDTVVIQADVARNSKSARFVDIRGRLPPHGQRENDNPYSHAKLLWFEGKKDGLLVTGSANASVAAFLAEPNLRNAELVLARLLPTNSPDLKQLGLREILKAPHVRDTDWAAIRKRLPDTESDTAQGISGVVLAVAEEGGFSLGTKLDRTTAISILDDTGGAIGNAIVETQGPPAFARAAQDVVTNAAFLDIRDKRTQRYAVVQQPSKIANNFVSDTRRALRQALGSIEGDPTQIDELLRLSEKVIFDSDEVTLATQIKLTSQDDSGSKTEHSGPPSLAVDAQGRKRGRRRSFASGDITVLLDALIHRLGQGLDLGQPREEVQPGSDSDDSTPHEPPDLPRLASLCRSKVRRLVKRMNAQLELADDDGNATRAIVQLATVLSVLRMLRTVERRDEWRREREQLLDDDALAELFESATDFVAGGNEALIPMSMREAHGERFEEISIVVGLLIWLAWDCEVDLDRATQNGGQLGVDEDLWYWIQHLAFVAPWLEQDEHAQELAAESVASTTRKGVDHLAWLETHCSFLNNLARVLRNPSTENMSRPIRPGDFVLLPNDFDPQLRLVTSIETGTVGDKVAVIDRTSASGFTKFLASRLRPIDCNSGKRLARIA